MKAFEIEVNGKKLDYRIGKELNLEEIKDFLKSKYKVISLKQTGRHVIGTVKKDSKDYFLKIATSEGISYLTKAEYEWNNQFNIENPRETSDYWVPKNIDNGIYKDKLFYLVTDKFNGHLLTERPEKSTPKSFLKQLPAIIEFSELIQNLNIDIPEREHPHQKFFKAKVLGWYQAIPRSVRKDYRVDHLLKIVETSYQKLEKKTRHGDFTPWHFFSLKKGGIGLIDGEHAMGNGVEYYDVAYLIQRVFCVLENPDLAKNILSLLKDRKYDLQKLRTVLAARGIGGFLDESLKEKPNYNLSNDYKYFISSIS